MSKNPVPIKDGLLDLDSSMNTIKEIVTCLPKSSLSRNNRNVTFTNEDSIYNCSTSEQRNVTFDQQSSNSIKSFSNFSSTSSSNSSGINNLTQMIGKTNYNYSKIVQKGKKMKKI